MNCSTTWPCASLADASLAGRTTIRVGGRVAWLLEPATPDELVEAVSAVRERGLPLRVLGGGANVVVDDGVLPWAVVTTDRMRRVFRPLQVREDDVLEPVEPARGVAPQDPAEDPRLVAWAGATLPSLCRAARDLGYSGFERMAGVPGQLGGGVAMNAGGRGWQVADAVELLRVIEPDGTVSDVPRDAWDPVYRDGRLGERIVVGAVLRFTPAPRLVVERETREYLRRKNAVQPVSERSAGCVFKNPDPEVSGGRTAGQLVDEAGGRGRRRGDALISPRHGNFLVNAGEARASDVFALLDEVRDLVAQRSGVRLELEVQCWRADEGARG